MGFNVQRFTFITKIVSSCDSHTHVHKLVAHRGNRKRNAYAVYSIYHQFTAVDLPCWACMYGVNALAVRKSFTVHKCTCRETNMLSTHNFHQWLIES